jgi:2-polyprenyl-3-methyl-5-hydroxy-6-metoxy-1,4-benzoquinol methylase
MINLTKKENWDQNYIIHKEITELQFGWRNHVNKIIAQKIEEIGLVDKNILEIGAGNSQWLTYLAKKYPNSRFAGLDYSKIGCEKLAERANNILGPKAIDIYNEDMFFENSELHGKFDLIFSLGVIEHFTELSNVLLVKRKYLKDHGLMFSLIPNLAGSIGYLVKSINREIYDMHNPHDLNSFFEGHRKAGLTVISSGYLGSINFGMISSCFKKSDGFNWHFYVFLSRLSKFIGWLETKLGDLPSSKIFSPYIYVISRAD